MGSYISILNDTPDDWVCKMSYDQVALKIGILIASIVGVIATVIATGGMSSPLMTVAMGAGVTAVLGVSTSALGTVGQAITGITGGIKIVEDVSQFSYNIAKGIIDKLSNDNFMVIKAGSKHSWKRTLSLWQQGTCVQTTIVDERTVNTRTLYMRPIFSGPTIDSNIDHSISWWLNQHGTKDEKTVADPKVVVPPTAKVIGNSSTEVTAHFLQPVAKPQ